MNVERQKIINGVSHFSQSNDRKYSLYSASFSAFRRFTQLFM